jgi:hypothetical protein
MSLETYRQRNYLPPPVDLQPEGELLDLHEWVVAHSPRLGRKG